MNKGERAEAEANLELYSSLTSVHKSRPFFPTARKTP
jgi:hypothetical protein